ncbi:MAG: hypothetical protein IJW10_06220 [Clostridia bacterium]|nr:hypothetical protein [Clostridia bacterium]
MYIAATTENGETIYWNGYAWTESGVEAQTYGEVSGSYEIGKLEADYIDTEYPKRYKGERIVRIYGI